MALSITRIKTQSYSVHLTLSSNQKYHLHPSVSCGAHSWSKASPPLRYLRFFELAKPESKPGKPGVKQPSGTRRTLDLAEHFLARKYCGGTTWVSLAWIGEISSFVSPTHAGIQHSTRKDIRNPGVKLHSNPILVTDARCRHHCMRSSGLSSSGASTFLVPAPFS